MFSHPEMLFLLATEAQLGMTDEVARLRLGAATRRAARRARRQEARRQEASRQQEERQLAAGRQEPSRLVADRLRQRRRTKGVAETTAQATARDPSASEGSVPGGNLATCARVGA